jgi:hypothetical protein
VCDHTEPCNAIALLDRAIGYQPPEDYQITRDDSQINVG